MLLGYILYLTTIFCRIALAEETLDFLQWKSQGYYETFIKEIHDFNSSQKSHSTAIYLRYILVFQTKFAFDKCIDKNYSFICISLCTMFLQDMSDHASPQLPAFQGLQQYLTSLWHLFLHPFTQICQVSFLLLFPVSLLLCLVSIKFSKPALLYVLSISAISF